MNLNYTLFKGVSVQLNDHARSEEIAARMASAGGVRKHWPLELFQLSRPEVEWAGAPMSDKSFDASLKSRRTTNESTHVMTQVDRLREEGFTGSGIKVAVIDTGVRDTRLLLGHQG